MAEQVTTDRNAPRGTWTAAPLVTDYFSIEYRLNPQFKWRAPASRPAKMRNLRRRLSDIRQLLGHIDTATLTERPNAGQALYPMPCEYLGRFVRKEV